MQLQRHQWAVTVYNIKHTYCVRILLDVMIRRRVERGNEGPVQKTLMAPPHKVYTEQGSRTGTQTANGGFLPVRALVSIHPRGKRNVPGKKRSRERVD